LGRKTKVYQFNTKDLSFGEIKPALTARLRNVLIYTLLTSIVAILFNFMFILHFDSLGVYFLTQKTNKHLEELKNIDTYVDSLKQTLVKIHREDDNLYRCILQMDSLPSTIRSAGTGGSENNFGLNQVNFSMVLDISEEIEILKNQLNIQNKSYDEIHKRLLMQQELLRCMPAIQPVNTKDLIFISSYFGMRTDPFTFLPKIHRGIDFVANMGTKVYATGDGIVTLSKSSRKGYGNEVIINHSFGYSTRYGHLNEILVMEGQKIKRGQVIGTVGSSGRSTGPHLHYEVRLNRRPVNPINYYTNLTEEEFARIVENTTNLN
jgi:murein DD-endopeptidase MepM/ murein hydrolase activator NlpD